MPLLTIVFTDVVESSAIKRDVSLGRDTRERDRAYLEKVQTRHFDLVRASCQAQGGKEVSTMGDAFYLTFEDPVAAVRCAIDIQRRLASAPIDTPRGPLRLRIGIHSGFPEFFEGSWHGTDVDTAARVEATAAERQILLSSRTYELVRQMTDVRFHPRGEFALKGVDRMALWEADWDGKGPRPTAGSSLRKIERKRAIKRIALAMVALILLSSAAGYLILRHRTRFKYFEAPRKSLAVLTFKNNGNTEEGWMENALPDMLDTELAAGTGLRVISGEEVAQATSDLALSRSSSYRKDTLRKLRAILKSDYVLAGSYVASGNSKSDSIRVDVRLQDAQSGEIVSAFPVDGTVGAMADLLKQIGAAVRQKLRIPSPNEADVAKTQAALSENSDATRLYSEGLSKLRTFDALGARDSLERAISFDPNWAAPHAALADALELLGYDSMARDEAAKAVELSAKLSEVDRRTIEARYRELNYEWDKAIEIYHDLWGVFSDEPSYALDLAKVQTAAGKGKDALATLADLERLPNMADDPRINLARAFAAESLSDVKLQQGAAAAAAEKATALGARYLAAQAYWQQCTALYFLGELDKAMTACQQSAAAAPFALEIEARTKTVEASILLAEGHAAEALEMRRQALDTARKIGSQKDIIGALDNLANLVYMNGDTKAARDDFNEAFRLAQAIGDQQQLLQLENDYAGDLYGYGDFAGAEELYRKSLATAQEIQDQERLAMARQNLGLVLMLRGDLVGAKQQIQQAIVVQRPAGLQSDLASSLNTLGDLLLIQNDLSGARNNYEESLRISTDLHATPGIASSRSSLAELALAEGKPIDAEALAIQAADSFQDQKFVDPAVGALNTLARAYLAQGKIAGAQSAVDRALELNSQDRATQLSLQVTAARLKARAGDAAGAKRDLDGCLNEARKLMLVGIALESSLAEAEIIATSSPKSALTQLELLQVEANSKGYLRLASEAAHARQNLAHGSPRAG
jgi:class 3 adenylate cyclase/tetratricopeptide (TPR) repeat protein